VSRVEEILSVGIDIGTTTTSMVISRLKIRNIAGIFATPKIEIVEKRVVHRSGVYLTPLVDEINLNFAEVAEIIKKEYRLARVNPDEIRTGAVIITGDAARKENAENVLKAISNTAGSFVVAAAGPRLEAVLAGRGSGAAQLSKDAGLKICNIDIGGGTTNAAVFDKGKLVSTFCANIGGRLIKFVPGTNVIAEFSPAGKTIAEECGVVLCKGIQLTMQSIVSMADRLADCLLNILSGKVDGLSEKLAIGRLPESPLEIDCIMFSGGVGRLFYEDETKADAKSSLKYGDIGPILAEMIRSKKNRIRAEIIRPVETIYATVIGAGIHSTELSGSTIYISDPEILPLKDIPVVRIDDPYKKANTLKSEIMKKIEIFKDGGNTMLPALVIPQMAKLGFNRIRVVVNAIAEAVRTADHTSPVVIVCEDDIGNVVGVLLYELVRKERVVISIDQIIMKEGDYIDIGKPLYNGKVVPVALKTLVFAN